jgi:hypothetical protein
MGSFLHVLNTKDKIWLAISRQTVYWLKSTPERRKCRLLGVQKEIATAILRHIFFYYMTMQVTQYIVLCEKFCH